MRFIALAALAATGLLAQYTVAPSEAPPPEVAAPISALLNKEGVKVTGPDGVFMEVWLVAKLPSGANSQESSVTLPMIPIGAVLGVVRFPGKGADRRAQTIKPGVYTMRYADFPINGDHQGVAPQRDFAVLSPAGIDKDPKPPGDFDALMNLSRKTSGTPHPAVLSMWKQDSDFKPGLHLEGESDWVWNVKVGDVPLAIILVGKASD
ncbi:MAG: hypothetical protein ABI823_19290 [Bryobacteraceae bacterium]